MTTDPSIPPHPSALSNLLSTAGTKLHVDALPQELLHNLQYQHNWTDLRIHSPQVNPTQDSFPSLDNNNSNYSSRNPTPTSLPRKLISGLPPRHIYIHPDFQALLIKVGVRENEVKIQREWVLPMSIGETWTLKRFSEMFESLPARDPIELAGGVRHRDAKRVMLGMLSHNGMGGDGTVVYYIMQEGDVKPRQN